MEGFRQHFKRDIERKHLTWPGVAAAAGSSVTGNEAWRQVDSTCSRRRSGTTGGSATSDVDISSSAVSLSATIACRSCMSASGCGGCQKIVAGSHQMLSLNVAANHA